MEMEIPYEIKIDTSEIDEMFAKFYNVYDEGTALKQILNNAQTDREVSDLYLNLVSDKYTKYRSWDNYSDNFKSISLKGYSLVSQIRQIINGMINEIKRLEEENESLKHVGK